MRGAGRSAKLAWLEYPSSAFAALRHLLPQGEKAGTRWEKENRFIATLISVSDLRTGKRARHLLPLWEKVAEPQRSAGEAG